MNREREIVLVNIQLERQFGYSRDELLGNRLEVLIPERFQGQQVNHWGNFDQLGLRPSGPGTELYARRKDGTEFPVAIDMIPLETDEEILVRGEFRDITNQKQIDESLRLREERFRVALENSPVVVFNQDMELRYTWINRPVMAWASHDSLGHTDAEIIGGEDGARLTTIKQGVLDSGVGIRTEVKATFGGETRYFDLTVEPLRDSRGVLIGITCATTDVTAMKQAQEERERLVAELQDALAHVKLLNGLLPICAECKRIRDNSGNWLQIENYISGHSEAKFTHGLCPDCGRKLYGDLFASER